MTKTVRYSGADKVPVIKRFREPGGWKPVLVENTGISLPSCRLNMPFGTSRYGRKFLRYGNRVCKGDLKYNVTGGNNAFISFVLLQDKAFLCNRKLRPIS